MTHTCPRRAEDGTDQPGIFRNAGPNLDEYAERNSDGVPRCSYCGSLEPERAITLIEDGTAVIPTDKPYKMYLRDAARQGADPSRLEVVSSTNQESPGYKSWKELSKTEKTAVREAGHADDRKKWFYRFRPIGPTESQVKFYTAHWTQAQGDWFLQLHAMGRVVIGSPGYFYSALFIPHSAAGCMGECPTHRLVGL